MSKEKRLAQKQIKTYECELKRYQKRLSDSKEGSVIHRHALERVQWYTNAIRELKATV